MTRTSAFAVGLMVIQLSGCASALYPVASDAVTADGAARTAPVPRTLDESLRTLRRDLPADMQALMKASSEDEMVRFHFTPGLWLRNTWLNGRQPKPLREWFLARYGLGDPEEISGIVLRSFWRDLHGRPIDVDGQVAAYREDAAQRAANLKAHQQRLMVLVEDLLATRLEWTVAANDPTSVMVPARTTDHASLRLRYMARFRNGLLVMAKHYDVTAGPAARHPDRTSEQFRTRCYFVNTDTFTVAPVHLREIGPVDECVVSGSEVFFAAATTARYVIVRLSDDRREMVWMAAGDSWSRLGADADGPLVVRPTSVQQHDGQSWSTLASPSVPLPKAAEPPRVSAGRLWLRDEGPGDGLPGRLSGVALEGTSARHYFDEQTRWTLLLGAALRVVWRHEFAPDGSQWVLSDGALVVAEAEHHRVAALDAYHPFDVTLPVFPGNEPVGVMGGPTAVEFLGDGCVNLATRRRYGPELVALYRVCDGVARRLLSFTQTEQVIAEQRSDYHWGWTPTYISTINDRTMVIGGEYGGLYLLRRNEANQWEMRSLDESPLDRPVFF